MATNFVQAGSQITIPAPELVSSGGVVIAGNIVGVALGGAASGKPVDIAVTGIWELPKVGAENMAVGAPVYWDSSPGLVTLDDDEGNVRLGTVVKAAAGDTGTVAVRLVSI